MAFSVLVLRSFLESMERMDIARDDLLVGVLAESALEQEDLWLENAQFYEVVARGLRLSGDSALGLHTGEGSNFMAFDAAGLLFSLVPTFMDAVAAMARYHNVARDEQDVFLHEEGHALVVRYHLFDAKPPVRECLAELVLSCLASLLRQFAGRGGVPERVELDYPAPPHAAEYERVFGSEVLFEQTRVALVVDRRLAQRAQLLARPELADELRRRAEARRRSGAYPRTIVGRVRYHLRESWTSGQPSMEGVARSMGMSQRSLHRYLAREGADYRSILAEARCEVAAQLLRQPGLGVKQVSHELGFANSSAFYRAFKRWMGCSPSSYAARGRSTKSHPLQGA